MPSVLVTGANRGLGRAIARGFVARGWEVWGAARQTGDHDAGVRPVALDLLDPASIDSLPERLGVSSLDLLFNCAGLMGPYPPALAPADIDGWDEIFGVNVIGTMRLTLALLPLLEAGGRRIVSLTSRYGSIGENDEGRMGPYRASKAALNAAMHNLSVDLEGRDFIVAIVTPGWVRTDMGGPDAPVGADERGAELIALALGLRPEHSGRFLNFDGDGVPW